MQQILMKFQGRSFHVTRVIRRILDIMILALLILSIISFSLKWLPLLGNIKGLFDSFYPMIDNLFLIIVILEVADILHKASPVRLMDILMTIMVRKIIIAQASNVPWLDVLLFSLVAIIRFLWTKWIPNSNTYCFDDES